MYLLFWVYVYTTDCVTKKKKNTLQTFDFSIPITHKVSVFIFSDWASTSHRCVPSNHLHKLFPRKPPSRRMFPSSEHLSSGGSFMLIPKFFQPSWKKKIACRNGSAWYSLLVCWPYHLFPKIHVASPQPPSFELEKKLTFFLCLVCFCNAVKTHVEVFAKFLSCCLLNSRQ